MNTDDRALADLKPCPNPWCRDNTPKLSQRGGHLYYVMCTGCGIKCDYQHTECAAVDDWNTRPADRLEAFPAKPVVGERVEETGWLIEYGPSSPTAPRYWGGVRGWTYDHTEAVRFSRQVDAQSIAESMDDGVPGNYRLAEHAWSSAALQSPPPVVSGEASGWLIEENAGDVVHWIALAENEWPRTEIHVRRRTSFGRDRMVESDRYRSPVVRVKDASLALRFARKEDAEALIKLFDRFLLCPVATEHAWSAPR